MAEAGKPPVATRHRIVGFEKIGDGNGDMFGHQQIVFRTDDQAGNRGNLREAIENQVRASVSRCDGVENGRAQLRERATIAIEGIERKAGRIAKKAPKILIIEYDGLGRRCRWTRAANVSRRRRRQSNEPGDQERQFLYRFRRNGRTYAVCNDERGTDVLEQRAQADDDRSRAGRELESRAPSLHRIAGNLAMPGFTAPKILWVAEHEPEHFKRTATVLLPKDYLRLRLTGDKVSDLSDASGTLWLDVANRIWSEELLAATGLSSKHMPSLIEGSESSGYLREELAKRWGLSHPAIVAGGGGDNAASAVGMGAISAGSGFVSLGTSGVVFVVNDRFRPNPQSAVHAFCHALPHRWHQMSVMLSAASCLRWVVALTGAQSETTLLAEVSALGEQTRRRAPIFLPYLSGERTPHNDPAARGVFFGLTHGTDRAALGYAVLEGVAFGLADGWAALGTTAGTVSSLSLVGGGARSDEWAQLIATVLDTPIHTHSDGQAGAALGAARLARIACGAAESDVCKKPKRALTFDPQPQAQVWLEERRQRFRALYETTRPLFKRDALSRPT
jgi:xylulokinase